MSASSPCPSGSTGATGPPPARSRSSTDGPPASAPPHFARFVAVDWSGARDPAAQRRAIVCCVVERHGAALRVVGLENGRDRAETVAWLAGLAADRGPTLAGLDFPFAYAAPFLDHLGAPDFPALLARMGPLDTPAARGPLDAFVLRCGAWWNACGDRRDRTHRHVERLPATRGVASPLEARPSPRGARFVGPRQVGLAAITGLASIAALKARAPLVRVWPFEEPAGASLVLAEVWPRLALGRLRKSDPAERRRWVRQVARQGVGLGAAPARLAEASDHALDALAAALAMASGRWRLPARSTLPPGALREGWILGVDPDPASPSAEVDP